MEASLAFHNEASRNIVKNIGFEADMSTKLENGCPLSVEAGVVIPLFNSPCDLPASTPALSEAFPSLTEKQLKASILKEGIIAIFSGFLIVAFCIVSVVVPSAELPWAKACNGEPGQGTYLGSHNWARRLYGLLATCLCLLGSAWLSECKWSRNCNLCPAEVEMSKRRDQEAEQMVRQARHAKQQFMTYVFQNIRVPFNAIVLGLGHVRVKAEKGLLSQEITDTINLIEMMLDCAETMTSVLDDVTNMDEWEEGTMELHLEEFDLFGLVKFLLCGLKDLLSQKQMRFSISIDPIAKAVLSSNHVLGDKHRVLQTLGNCLSNAVKLSPSGGKLELSIKCDEVLQSDASSPCKSEEGIHNARPNRARSFICPCLRESSRKHPKESLKDPPICTCCHQGSFAKVVITVKDMSNGISVEDQAKLFEPYSLISTGWIQKAGVSNLGLNMAKRFVELSGGYIGVDSKEGEGSMFSFCLPYPLIPITHGVEYKLPSNAEWLDAFNMDPSKLSQAPCALGKRERTLVKEETAVCIPLTSDKGHQKVLLVEDTQINRIILKKVLQNLNLGCEEAENGQVAVDFLKQGRTYDLILMDKEMPVMDGHEATRQLRMMGVKTPIVALTGNALKADKELFFEAGVDDFQTKPLSRDKLVQVLARFGVEIPSGK